MSLARANGPSQQMLMDGSEGVCAAHRHHQPEPGTVGPVASTRLQPVGQGGLANPAPAFGGPSPTWQPRGSFLILLLEPTRNPLVTGNIVFQILASSRKPTGNAPISKHLLPCQQAPHHGSVMSSWEQGCLEDGMIWMYLLDVQDGHTVESQH